MKGQADYPSASQSQGEGDRDATERPGLRKASPLISDPLLAFSRSSAAGDRRSPDRPPRSQLRSSAPIDGPACSVKLRVTVPDDEFETMQARTRSYRRRVAELGGVSGSLIKENVRERLRLRTASETLTRAHDELADEIIALLMDTRLSRHQAALLEREFFGR